MKPKGIIIVLLSLSLVVVSVQGQNGYKQEFAVGGSFAANFSTVYFRPKVPQKQHLAFYGGATARWITENHLGLVAEINYARQGWQEDFSEYEENNYRYGRTLNYIEIPFLTHIYFGGERARFFVNIGPKIAFLLSENTDQNLNGEAPHQVNEQHDMKVEGKVDWGLGGGPGFELRTGIGSFLVEGRYYYGLGNLYGSMKEDRFAISAPHVITAKITYMFTLWKKK